MRFCYILFLSISFSATYAQSGRSLDSLLANCTELSDKNPIQGLKQSLALYQKADKQGFADVAHKALVCAGRSLIQQSLYDSAIAVMQQSLDYFPKSEMPYGIYVRYHTARAHYYLGEYSKAKSLLLEIMSQEKVIENVMHIRTLHLLGEVNRAAGIFTIAKKYFHQALVLARIKKDRLREAAALNRLGYASYQLNQPDSAEFYLNQSLEISNTHQFHSLKVSNYNDLGEVYNNSKDFDKAIKLYKSALQSVADKEQLINTHINLSWVYRESQAFKEAEKHGLKALELADETGIISYERNALEILANIYRDIDQPEKATHYYKRYFEILSAIQQKGNLGKMNQLEIAYQTQQTQLQMENLRIKADSEKKQNRLYYGSAILFLLLAGIIVLIYSRLQKTKAQRESKARALAEATARAETTERKRVQEKLEHQKRELTSQTLSLMRQNEFVDQLKEEVHHMKGGDFGNLKKMLKNNHLQKQDWQHFDKSFKEMHPSFLKSLLAINSRLTTKDIRLAALLKLGMNNREIAQLLSINYTSINQAKYRLKKKLQIDLNQSLEGFIFQLESG